MRSQKKAKESNYAHNKQALIQNEKEQVPKHLPQPPLLYIANLLYQ